MYEHENAGHFLNMKAALVSLVLQHCHVFVTKPAKITPCVRVYMTCDYVSSFQINRLNPTIMLYSSARMDMGIEWGAT